MPKLTLRVSHDVCDAIDSFARREGVDHIEAMRRIFSLVKIANEEAREGRHLGIVCDRHGKLDAVAKLVGV